MGAARTEQAAILRDGHAQKAARGLLRGREGFDFLRTAVNVTANTLGYKRCSQPEGPDSFRWCIRLSETAGLGWPTQLTLCGGQPMALQNVVGECVPQHHRPDLFDTAHR